MLPGGEAVEVQAGGVAREVEQYQRQQNEALSLGKSILEDLAMKALVMLLMKRREQFMRQTAV